MLTQEDTIIHLVRKTGERDQGAETSGGDSGLWRWKGALRVG